MAWFESGGKNCDVKKVIENISENAVECKENYTAVKSGKILIDISCVGIVRGATDVSGVQNASYSIKKNGTTLYSDEKSGLNNADTGGIFDYAFTQYVVGNSVVLDVKKGDEIELSTHSTAAVNYRTCFSRICAFEM